MRTEGAVHSSWELWLQSALEQAPTKLVTRSRPPLTPRGMKVRHVASGVEPMVTAAAEQASEWL